MEEAIVLTEAGCVNFFIIMAYPLLYVRAAQNPNGSRLRSVLCTAVGEASPSPDPSPDEGKSTRLSLFDNRFSEDKIRQFCMNAPMNSTRRAMVVLFVKAYDFKDKNQQSVKGVKIWASECASYTSEDPMEKGIKINEYTMKVEKPNIIFDKIGSVPNTFVLQFVETGKTQRPVNFYTYDQASKGGS